MNATQDEIYPMPMFPTFEVADVGVSVRWYREVLGFSIIFEMPDPSGRIFIAHIRRGKYQDLLLVPCKTGVPGGGNKPGLGVSITFAYPGEAGPCAPSLDDFTIQVRDAGADILEGPVDRPWNTRDLVVADPDGYQLVFTEPRFDAIRGTDFTQTMEKVRKAFSDSN